VIIIQHSDWPTNLGVMFFILLQDLNAQLGQVHHVIEQSFAVLYILMLMAICE
jgi:hypothetical protein